jgi:hypothetical protein
MKKDEWSKRGEQKEIAMKETKENEGNGGRCVDHQRR